MQVTTSWEEKGIEKERRSLVSILVNQKFEQLPDSLTDRISSLSLDKLSAKQRAVVMRRAIAMPSH